MRQSGLEPPRAKRPTRPSTLRVYQFRHWREGLRSVDAAAQASGVSTICVFMNSATILPPLRIATIQT